MKTIRLTMTATVTDETFEKEILEIKSKVLSGRMQRELTEPERGVFKVKITFEEL